MDAPIAGRIESRLGIHPDMIGFTSQVAVALWENRVYAGHIDAA
jgi:hypothetical protein